MAARASTISSSRAAWRALTWQVSPRNKISAYFDEIDKYRGHDMQSNYDPETAATVWNSPAYHTTAIKWTSPVTSSLFLEAGWSNNTEYYTNEYREGIEKPRGSAEWFANAAKNELDLGGYTQRRPDQHHREPGGVLLERGGDVGQGRSHHQVRRQQPPGHVQAHARWPTPTWSSSTAAATTGVRWSVPDSGADPQLAARPTASGSIATSASTSRTRGASTG